MGVRHIGAPDTIFRTCLQIQYSPKTKSLSTYLTSLPPHLWCHTVSCHEGRTLLALDCGSVFLIGLSWCPCVLQRMWWNHSPIDKEDFIGYRESDSLGHRAFGENAWKYISHLSILTQPSALANAERLLSTDPLGAGTRCNWGMNPAPRSFMVEAGRWMSVHKFT